MFIEEKISNNLLTFSFTLWKKCSFTKPQNVVANKETRHKTFYFFTCTVFLFLYVNHIFNCQTRDTIQLQSLLFRQVSGLEKRGYTIIPEVVGCPLLRVSTATGPQNTKNFLVLCQAFCVHSCVNCICLGSVSCFSDWNGQVSQNSHVNSKESPKYLPAGLEAHPRFQFPTIPILRHSTQWLERKPALK